MVENPDRGGPPRLHWAAMPSAPLLLHDTHAASGAVFSERDGRELVDEDVPPIIPDVILMVRLVFDK